MNQPCPNAGFSVDNVSVVYNGSPAIAGATLRIEPGEAVAFVGPAGRARSSWVNNAPPQRTFQSGTD